MAEPVNWNRPEEGERRVLFDRFHWAPHTMQFAELRHEAAFAERVRDVARGALTVLEIQERDYIDGTCADEDGDPLPALLLRFT